VTKKDRRLPANIDSERVVLGELMLNNAAWEKAQVLTDDDFSLASNQRIFACIRSRLAIKRPIDLILLIDAMKRQNELDVIGGPAYLCSLTEDNMRNLAIMEHIELLKEKAALRHILTVCHDATLLAYKEESSEEIINKIKDELGGK
jgi:replicative DNA helicase